ncbi:MAG: ABC transporter permease, partial [Mesorhizobium sp.]
MQWIIDVQRDIYLAFAGHIRAFADGGSWTALA